jgi:hypothetical protein
MMDEELADLAEEEAEGAAESFDDVDAYEDTPASFDEDAYDEGDDFDLGEDEGDEFDDEDAFGEFDEGDVDEDFGDEEGYEDEADEGELEEAMALALGAEDTDEFFRRAFGALRRVGRGVARVARRAAPVVGRIARAAAPIARAIPLPWARAAGPLLNLLGQLRAEGASDEEALEAMSELAAYDESVLPVVGGLAARSVIGPRIARMSVAARRRIVRNIAGAARTLVRRRGPAAARALPRVVRSVRRAAAVRRTPPAARPRIVQRTVQRVARQPQILRRLARPTPAARQRVRRVIRRTGIRGGRRRSFVVRRPMRITITAS